MIFKETFINPYISSYFYLDKMARMYSRKKGKSGSTKPHKKSKITWIRYGDGEIEMLILKLAKAGKSKSEVGAILRDTYGIPDVRKLLKKKIGKVIIENKIAKELPEDLASLMKKEIKILKHLEKNKKDMPSRRGLQLTESKIHRLAKYYKRSGKLPQDWVYDRDKAKLIVG